MSDSVDTTVDTTSSRERIKRALSHGKKGRINKDLSNKIMLGVFRAAAYITTLVLVAIIAYVVINGLPHISLDFIFGWPQGVNAEGGIWPTIVSTVYVTALAMLICTPIAVLAAVYLAEYAKQGKVVELIRYAADALASVPSIVMGLFGYALFVEAMGLGLSMVSAALALALLMLPIVMRTTEEAIRAVPRYIRWGAYGLGATKWQVVSKIVLPSAFGRIATGIVLAIGRAIGETAVVLYTMGQAINLPISPLDSGRPMTVHLYLLANDGINMNAAYGTALLLMVIILAFNLFARFLSRKRRELRSPMSVYQSAPALEQAAITAKDFNFWYGDFHALTGLDLNIAKNAITSFIGPSGCGKSTFLRCINRMNDLIEGTRVEGTMTLDGNDIYAEGVDPVDLRRRVGMIFQQPNPFPKSIYENVAFGPRLQGVTSKSDLDDIVEESLKRANLWKEVSNQLNKDGLALSGGQQQRLCIARVLAVQPDVLLMDEPCSAIDPTSVSKVEDLMAELAPEMTIIIVTHSMQQAARISDYTAFFLQEVAGEPATLIEYGQTDAIFTSPVDSRTEDYITGRFG